jgi:CRISPR-associated endonuclease Csn1
MIKRIDEIVDPHIRIIIKQQLNGRTLEKAFSEGIWMIKRNGEKDKKFRHLRCFADITDPLTIKKQTYLSKEEYKQNYYAANATSFLYALYEDENGKRKFIPLNLFSATQIKREIDVKNNKDFFESSFTFGKSNNIFRLSAILRPGLKVLFYRDGDKTEIYGLSKQELLGRLYFIKNLFDAKTGTVQFQFHLEARSDKQLSEAFPKEQFGQKGKNGFSEINFLTPWPRLLLSPINFDFLIEKRDFEIKPDGEIVFK